MQIIAIVNACMLIPDSVVAKTIPAMQTQIDRDFMPHWQHKVKGPFKLEFVPASEVFSPRFMHAKRWPLPDKCWPLFLNKHSNEDNALGWHTDDVTQDFPVHGRVFVGDCMRFGLQWEVTQDHELLELMADPMATRVYRMHNGDLAALEVCDAVEADDQSYDIDGVPMSNFVLPAYFSVKQGAMYDAKHMLHSPCPTLTPGGYMSIYKKGEGWTQVQAMKGDGIASRRAILRAHSFRKDLRHCSSLLEEF